MDQSLQSFTAPWDRTVNLVTLIIGVVCLGLSASLWPVLQAGPGSIHFWGALSPVLIVLVAAFFRVQGYQLEDDELIVRRLVWNRRINLKGLRTVEAGPDLLQEGRVVLGSTGFFGFTGLFKHPKAGSFRTWVTAPSQLLLLRLSDRAIAISPGEQEEFLAALAERHPEANLVSG